MLFVPWRAAWLRGMLLVCTLWVAPISHAQDAGLAAQWPATLGPGAKLRFSIIKTGEVTAREGLVFSAGEFGKKVLQNFVAVLIEHGDQTVLLDTGLGDQIDQQYLNDMVWWGRLLFTYQKLQSVRAQLAQAGLPAPQRIVLSHGHWDHAGGALDFPDVPILVPDEEIAYVAQPHTLVLPSQFRFATTRWQPIHFGHKPVAGISRSFELFGDASATLVPMPGHTPGSMGLLLVTGSGKRFFLVGDAVWKAEAIAAVSPRFWLARQVADADQDQALQRVSYLHAFQASNPDVVIIPAHDADVHQRLGYFPQWVQ